MTPAHAQRLLAGPIRARINRLAHSHALQLETHLKASLLKQVQAARDGGASFDEQAAMVAKLEAAPLGVWGLKVRRMNSGNRTVLVLRTPAKLRQGGG